MTPDDAPPSYREVVADRRREFFLTGEGVRVVQRSLFGTAVDATVPYERIDPRRSTLHVRSGLFKTGWRCLLAGAAAVWLAVKNPLDLNETPVWIVAGFLLVSGSVIAVWTFRRTEYASFDSDAGVPVLDVARSGPSAGQFEMFLEELAARVRVARDAG